MGRIGLAAALAAMIHALLFIVDDAWLKKNLIRATAREPIAVTLIYFNPQKKPPSPEERTETPRHEPMPSEKVPESPFQKQKPVKEVEEEVRVWKPPVPKENDPLAQKDRKPLFKPKEPGRPENPPIDI